MTELYDSWNIQKKRIEAKERISYFHEREICFVSLGKNIGFEEDGKNEYFERPVIASRNFSRHTFLAIPLTTSQRDGRFYYSFSLNKKNSYSNSFANQAA